MSWYSCKNFHECKQVCTYRLLSSGISVRNQALVTQAECQQDYSNPCFQVLTSERSSTRSLRAWILQTLGLRGPVEYTEMRDPTHNNGSNKQQLQTKRILLMHKIIKKHYPRIMSGSGSHNYSEFTYQFL